jgi:hypothetical protein
MVAGLHFFIFDFCHCGWSAHWLSQTVLVFKLAHNGLGLCEVGAFKAQMFNLAQMFIRITNA